MKTSSAMFLATAGASLASATPTPLSNVTQTFQCPGPDGNFCVGDSMSTLLSCTAGIPKPAIDCCEQTASQPPLGSQEASCYQSSPISGDAACTKNCIVYPLNGGNSYPVPGECTASNPATSEAAPPAYPSETVPPTYPSAAAPPADVPEASSAAPTESMSIGIKPPFPFKFPGPMFNMTFPPSMQPPAIPSSSAEAPPEYEGPSSAPPSMSMPFVPPMMAPTETAPPTTPAPEVFTKPLIEVSSEPAPEVFSKPLIEASSAHPVLETPAPTPAAPTLEMPSAPPAAAPPAISSMEAPPAPPAISSTPSASPMAPPSAAAPPAAPTSAAAAAPPAFSLPPFLSHIIGNFVHPPASSIPLPTTDMIATSTIPMTPVTHSYPSPVNEGPGAPYTYTTDSDFSLLPKATLPPYITTVTVGTKTQYHTIFSDCGNGTMIFGSSTITLPTGSVPNAVPLWHATDGASLPPLPTITTVPCSEASGWNNTSLYTPRKTSASYSYIATLPASATPSAPGSLFSQGDGYDHSSGSSSSIRQVSGFLLAGFVFGIAAMAL